MDEKPKKSPLLPIIIVIVIVVGVGIGAYFFMQGSEETDTNANTNQTAENRYKADTFSIVQPTGWEQVSLQGALVAFNDPGDTYPEGSIEAVNQFKSYMAVVFDNMHEQSLDELIKMTKDATLQANPSVTFAETTEETIDGQTAKIIEGQVTQQDTNFKIIMAFIAKGDRYFVITGNTSAEKWDSYQDTFYQVIRSFQFEYEVETDTNTDNTNQ